MIIMSIDPDVDKSGVAVFEMDIATRSTRLMRIESVTFPALIDLMKDLMYGNQSVVYVEAGWLNEWNWHLSSIRSGKVKDSLQAAAKIGEQVGRNHEVGRKIIEMAKHYGIEVEEIRPLVKGWTGNGKKITHNELIKYYSTEFPLLKAIKTNQETRDAFLLGNHQCNQLKLKLYRRG